VVQEGRGRNGFRQAYRWGGGSATYVKKRHSSTGGMTPGRRRAKRIWEGTIDRGREGKKLGAIWDRGACHQHEPKKPTRSQRQSTKKEPGGEKLTKEEEAASVPANVLFNRAVIEETLELRSGEIGTKK